MTLEKLSGLLMALAGVSFLPAIFVIAPILAVRALRRPNEKKFAKLYDGLRVEANPRPGLVCFRLHTYDGFLAWFTQTRHEGFAPPDDASKLLGRVLRYNLSHGILAAGGLFVPLVSVPEFFSQRRSVKHQAQQIQSELVPNTDGPIPNSGSIPEDAEFNEQDKPASWVAAVTWAVATIQTIVFLAAIAASLAAGQGVSAVAILGAIGTVMLWALAFDVTWR